MPSSLEWRLYYEENARSLLEIPWQLGPELTPDETAAIAQSLKEFPHRPGRVPKESTSFGTLKSTPNAQAIRTTC